MAVLTDRIGGSMQDELLRLTGSAGDPYEEVSATGDGGGGYRNFGSGDRLVSFHQLANSVPSGSPSVTTTIVAASDSSGTGAVTIGTFPALTATMVTAEGDEAVPPRIAVHIPAGKPFLKALNTFSGSGSIVMAVLPDPVNVSAP